MTPVLVQPSGWGQLVFNLLGIAVVGATLQRRFGWASWSLVYLAGGSGSIAVYSAWHPADTGGGSSAAVAALIGAFLVAVNQVAWVHLLGITLVITQPDGRESHVGWFSISVVAAAACLAASPTLRLLKRQSPAHGTHIWTGLCLGIALISVAGPLTLAVGTASMAALISLHLVCAAAILALLAPPAEPPSARPNARRRAAPTATAGPALAYTGRRI